MIDAARRLLRHPPRLWAPLLAHRIREAVRDLGCGMHDAVRSTYAPGDDGLLLRLLLAPFSVVGTAPAPPWLAPVSAMFLGHRFDWLGLGWREVGYGVDAAGLAGCRFRPDCPRPDRDGRWLEAALPATVLPDAAARWRMIEWPHEPIDWQRDHRSGYRWSEKLPSRLQTLEPALGADVKQPWELARLQHLPLLASAFAYARDGAPGFEEPARYAREFRNVVLDFAATNPPRYGINWRCSMDVAMRLCNVLVARDLFGCAGARFDDRFDRMLAGFVADHARHVRRNLERRPDFAANHYLTNLAGLAFAAAYLPGHRDAAEWREFSFREFIIESRRQFNPDGSNFEASVGYHRLSGEICAYVAAMLLRGAPDEAMRMELGSLLSGIREFCDAATRPDGSAVPVGDLDSGRLLRVATDFRAMTITDAAAKYPRFDAAVFPPKEAVWDEMVDHHGHLASACRTLLAGSRPDDGLEPRLLARLSGGRLASPGGEGKPRASRRLDPADAESFAKVARDVVAGESTCCYEVDLGEEATDLLAFRDFGLFVVRGRSWHVSIRCGSVGQRGAGGHAHNDQLSLTLYKGGRTLIEDAGVHVYNAIPDLRNAYRSVGAHFAPRPAAGEPGDLSQGPFRLSSAGEGTCLWFGPDGFAGEHHGFGFRVTRVVRWTARRLVVQDCSFGMPLLDLFGEGWWKPAVPVSRKYGCPESS